MLADAAPRVTEAPRLAVRVALMEGDAHEALGRHDAAAQRGHGGRLTTADPAGPSDVLGEPSPAASAEGFAAADPRDHVGEIGGGELPGPHRARVDARPEQPFPEQRQHVLRGERVVRVRENDELVPRASGAAAVVPPTGDAPTISSRRVGGRRTVTTVPNVQPYVSEDPRAPADPRGTVGCDRHACAGGSESRSTVHRGDRPCRRHDTRTGCRPARSETVSPSGKDLIDGVEDVVGVR